jgi:hypothetical protein
VCYYIDVVGGLEIEAHGLSVAIRWLHVAAMAMAFGGALMVAVVATLKPRPAPDAVIRFAATYEMAFWGAAGVLVMTGIGNAAAFGRDLPYPDSAWGAAFIVKLVGVGAIVVLSVPRTLTVVHLAAARTPDGTLVGTLYSMTATALVAIVAIAVWLAHG